METVVHVTTLKQWKSVLDVWFSQGFAWSYGPNVYNNRYFDDGERFLRLSGTKILRGKIFITAQPIEYADFMAKQEKKMTTYEVTQEQFDLIEKMKEEADGIPLYFLLHDSPIYIRVFSEQITDELDKLILRYLGGDETIEFKVKEQLYLLKRTTFRLGPIYFNKMGDTEENDYCFEKRNAFTAPLEEIKKWKTPDWEIEKAD